MRLIDRYGRVNNFNQNCRFKCIYDVLHCCGFHVGFDIVTLLAFSQYISSFIMPNVNKLSLIGASAFLPYFDLHVLEQFGVYAKRLPNEETDSIQALKNFVCDDKIVILYFDTADLMDKYKANTIRFNLLTSGIVLDVNEKKRTVTLNSLASNLSKVNVFDFDKLQKARKSEIVPIKPDSRAFMIDLHAIKKRNLDIRELVRYHVKQMADSYFEGGSFVFENSSVFYKGKDAYQSFYVFFEQLEKQCQNALQDPIIIDEILSIIIKVFMRSLIGSTKSFYRQEYGKALFDFSLNYQESLFRELSKKVIASSKEWKRLICYLNSINVCKDKCTFINQLMLKIKEIQRFEEELLHEFQMINL